MKSLTLKQKSYKAEQKYIQAETERILGEERPKKPYSLDEEDGQNLISIATDRVKQILDDMGSIEPVSFLAEMLVRKTEGQAPGVINHVMKKMAKDGRRVSEYKWEPRWLDSPIAFTEEIVENGKLIQRRTRVILRVATAQHLENWEMSIRRQSMKQVVAADLVAKTIFNMRRWLQNSEARQFGDLPSGRIILADNDD